MPLVELLEVLVTFKTITIDKVQVLAVLAAVVVVAVAPWDSLTLLLVIVGTLLTTQEVMADQVDSETLEQLVVLQPITLEP
jgi:hypothetical protein